MSYVLDERPLTRGQRLLLYLVLAGSYFLLGLIPLLIAILYAYVIEVTR